MHLRTQQCFHDFLLLRLRMTLAELWQATMNNRNRFPLHTSFRFAAEDKDIALEWPRLACLAASKGVYWAQVC